MRGGAALAVDVAALSLEELSGFVRALPRAVLLSLCALGDDWIGETRAAPPPPPVVLAAPVDVDEILTAEEAADLLRMSLDGVYARVARGELVPLPRCRGGRLKFRRGDLAPGIDQRYSIPHDTLTRQGIAPPARVDATRARRGAQRDDDDNCALGARRARRHAPRRGEPWAPNQGAWADPQGDPRPKGGGA